MDRSGSTGSDRLALSGSKLPRERDAAAARIHAAGEWAAVLDVRVSHAHPTPAKSNHSANGIVEIDVLYVAVTIQFRTGVPHRARSHPKVISQRHGAGELDRYPVDTQVGIV